MTIKAKINKLGIMVATAILFATTGSYAESPTQSISENKSPAWVKNAVFYQIYPQSYKDSNGDGIGDIQGVIEKLDYIKSIGVNTLWFNPLFKSPFKDAGYDITDFYQVDPRYGSNSDLVTLINEAHKRGLRVCLDLVAGHTSDQSAWFQQAKEGKDRRYSDYYIWPDRIPDDVKGKEKDQVGGTIGEDSFVKIENAHSPYFIKNYYASQPALNYGYAHPNPAHAWEQSAPSDVVLSTIYSVIIR